MEHFSCETLCVLPPGSRVDNGLITVSGEQQPLVWWWQPISCCIDSTDNNFSNIGGYNSNGLVVSQIDFINTVILVAQVILHS